MFLADKYCYCSLILNNLTALSVFFCISLSILFSQSFELVIFHGILVVVLVMIFRNHWQEFVIKSKPLWIYFPQVGLLFFIISLIVSSKNIYDVFIDVSIATCRMILLVSMMTLYSILYKNSDIIISIRGLWYKMGRSWQCAEDLILFIDITIRFFPSFQKQWHRILRTRKSLGINVSKNKLHQIRIFATMIPDMVILNLRRVNDLTLAMKLRGYGIFCPRTVYPFIPSNSIDRLILLFVIIGLLGLHTYGEI